MIKCLSHILFAAVAVLISVSHASLVDHDQYFTDSQSGLDWLDLTETQGMSFNYVSSQLGVGGEFEGWRYATSQDVEILLGNLGGVGPYTGSREENNGIVIPLLDLWGYTGVYGESTAIIANFNLFYDWRRSLLSLSDKPTNDNSATSDWISMGIGSVEESWELSYVGSALVRTSAVPVPAAFLLFSSGLLVMVGLVKKRGA